MKDVGFAVRQRSVSLKSGTCDYGALRGAVVAVLRREGNPLNLRLLGVCVWCRRKEPMRVVFLKGSGLTEPQPSKGLSQLFAQWSHVF